MALVVKLGGVSRQLAVLHKRLDARNLFGFWGVWRLYTAYMGETVSQAYIGGMVSIPPYTSKPHTCPSILLFLLSLNASGLDF